MGERVSQDHAASHDEGAEHASPGGAAVGSPAARAIVAQGGRDPNALAALLQAHPMAMREVMSLVHATMGNAFVQAIVGAMSSSGATGPMRVTASALRVRSSPNAAAHDNVLGGLSHGATITAIARDGEWVRISYAGQVAYVHGDYVEPVKQMPEAAVAAKSGNAASETEHGHATGAPEHIPAHARVEPAHAQPRAQHAQPAAAKPAAHAPTAQVAAQTAATKHESEVVQAEAPQPKAKKHGAGLSMYGGESVRAVLTRLAQAGQVALTGNQIALLDAVAQVETGGKIGCVQTYDDQVMSVGFKQVVLGYGSLEKIMLEAPAGFARHGLALDMAHTYQREGWEHPHKIVGADDVDALRGEAWARKFYAASMEPDVIAAMCKLALKEFNKVEAAVQKSAPGVDHFADPTARGWLLETYNNRPAFMGKAIARAVEHGARSAATRDAFLDVLSKAIIDTYVIEEPKLAYNKAKQDGMSGPQDMVLRAEIQTKYGEIGRQKGTNIVTKISRNLAIPEVGAGHGEAAHATATPALPAHAEPAPHAEAPKHAEPAHHAEAPKHADAHHAEPAKAHHAEPAKAHHAEPAKQDANAADRAQLQAESARLLKEFDAGHVDQSQAVQRFLAFDMQHHGGIVSPAGLEIMGALTASIATRAADKAKRAAPAAEHHEAAPAPTGKTAGTQVWTPPTTVSLGDANLEALAAGIHDPRVGPLMHDLAGVVTLHRTLYAKRDHKEFVGADRENLVAGIASVRAQLAQLQGGTNPAAVEAFRVAVNHKIQESSPYHSQVNIRTIETGAYTTCNVTSLAMALESTGRNADSYKASKLPTLLAVAERYSSDVAKARMTSHGNETDFSSLRGLRLPDFMELAAIAYFLHSAAPTEAEIEAAADKACQQKTHLDVLAGIAADFGAHADQGYLDLGRGGTQNLATYAGSHHAQADQIADARNAGDTAKHQRLSKATPLEGGDIENQVSIATYKNAVTAAIGKALDAGAGVVAGCWGHFTRCYAVTDTHVMVQDPGQYHRSERMLTWPEARALRFFWNYLVIK